ncbi:Subtilase family protein [Aquimarina amphilecti]|uniref:Subtilase family protein n=1 Tax=Aquimarina amphilecti TaxID=1038014 RepID=A0A1H7MTU9_AQUAM|nr:S8 family serine peptidase [Aquimarina amphilecti]SEL14479.1 Subtilase family protein [Aquimarina amphilecti]
MAKITKLFVLIVLIYQYQGVAQTKKVSRNWASFVQSIEIKTDKKTKFKLQGWVKVIGNEKDPNVKAGLWVRVDTKNNETAFFDNMSDRPITDNIWQQYEIVGELDQKADKLNFGGIVHYNGTFYFDDFKLYLEDENGNLKQVNIENGGFEKDDFSNSWYKGIRINNEVVIKEFEYNLSADHKEGEQSIKITGRNIPKRLSKEQLKTWYHKDYINDSVPGISLEKAYNKILKSKKGKEIIVAVLDTKLDIHHEDLKNQIWYNKNEIPNNGIDDDKNGYIDDINGWDFLSNTSGSFVSYAPLESTRIVKKYIALFSGKKNNQIPNDQIKAYQLYTSAFLKWKNDIAENKETLKNMKLWKLAVVNCKSFLDSISPKKEYKIVDIDSLLTVYKKDSVIQHMLYGYRNSIEYELTESYMDKYIKDLNKEKEITLNLNYNEREISGDDINNIGDYTYGSPIVDGDVPFHHSTAVSGTLGANRANDIGIQGFSNQIKIMPVVMVASGDEHDKDVALAIRYAVDNGAKIINMSWGKTLSSNEEWVNDAIKYAADKDVLLIKAGGNNNTNNDIIKYYLNDYDDTEKEFVDNLIVVGASSWNIQNLKANFSNYGKKHIDVFAPGVDMYTTEYGTDKYTTTGGTSLASPVVSGIAALIRSYYPKLSAKQVKKILLDSGSSFDVKVEIKQEDGTKKIVAFSELSKSGKIVNAYNALLLAEKISNQTN